MNDRKETKFISRVSLYLLLIIFAGLAYLSRNNLQLADFALIEWQTKIIHSHSIQNLFHLDYSLSTYDPELRFFPLPEIFFLRSQGQALSVFPPYLPLLYSFFYGIYFPILFPLLQFSFFIAGLYLLEKSTHSSPILLALGSLISLYVFLCHETCLVFFLQTLCIYQFTKKRFVSAGFFSGFTVLFRPEMILLSFFPFFLREREDSIQKSIFRYGIGLLSIVSVGILLQWIFTNSPLGLRIERNNSFAYYWEIRKYLGSILLSTSPLLFLFLLLHFFSKEKYKNNSFFYSILSLTLLIGLLAPNMGGHNTPRYFFGIFPYMAILSSRYLEHLHSLTRALIIIIFIFFGILNFKKSFQEMQMIARYEQNLISEISKIDSKMILFDNSDLSYSAVPLLNGTKEILLLRNRKDLPLLSQILQINGISQIAFIYLGAENSAKSHFNRLCQKDCGFLYTKDLQLNRDFFPLSGGILSLKTASQKF